MEIADKWFAIVNPVGRQRPGLTDWPLISRLLRERHIVPEYVFTERKYHAIELAVEAVNNGFRKIIVVGGRRYDPRGRQRAVHSEDRFRRPMCC